ncbi:hypothetical protein IKE99_01255 [Candidatus Saccharibacteria bacterium]|nr:hypothetical protein [Candidatus Saccharibacteria bacterium]
MGLFGFNRNKANKAENLENTSSQQWDNLQHEVPFRGSAQGSQRYGAYSPDALAKSARADIDQQADNIRKLQELNAKLKALSKPSSKH